MKDQTLYELLQMVPVQPGTFLMGEPAERFFAFRQVEVTLTRPFELGRYPVTNLIWSLVTGDSLEGVDPLLPKTEVSWNQAVEFCQRLNDLLELPRTVSEKRCRFDHRGFRLPTEAEWEYACRAGGPDSIYGPLDEIAWNFKEKPVGLKLPNAWGFYDMLGNNLEWCWDKYDSELQGGVNPEGPSEGEKRVLRGDWNSPEDRSSSTERRCSYPYHTLSGFRLARTLSRKKS